MKIMVTGATGFIGSTLVPLLLERNHEIVLLSRNPEKAVAHFNGRVVALKWDAEIDPIPDSAFSGTSAVIHLVGENVAGGRWTAAFKKKILASRLESGKRIFDGLKKQSKKIPLLIGASAIGYYGSAGDQPLDESSPLGTGFLAEVCRAWENSLAGANVDRHVTLRIGVVLGKGGGALAKILPIFKTGLGGRIGNGKKWMSWIHLADVCGMILHALEDDKMTGVYNVVAPEPATNEEFTQALSEALGRPAIIPVPEFALRFAFGEMANETVLSSAKVYPKRTLQAGYSFLYTSLTKAIKSVINEGP